MRQSRLSQFNDIKERLDARAEAFIDECFPAGRPSAPYAGEKSSIAAILSAGGLPQGGLRC